MIFPKAVQRGACVGLIAPASPITEEEGERCRLCLEAAGFQVKLGDTLQNADNIRGYLAGEARKRAEDLNRMFEDSRIEAIFCTRGGYGSIQMLEYLDYECIRKHPKIFTGYSDVTSLHCALQKKCNLVTFHGPMVKSDFLFYEGENYDAGKLDYTWKQLERAWHMKGRMEFQNPKGEALKRIRGGRAYGRLTGGNLSVLARLLGTSFVPDTRDCILFLEDVGEQLPRIDMYLTQMKLAGIFEGVRGILLGDFTSCGSLEDKDNGRTVEYLRMWFRELGVPVLGNVHSDHRHPMGTLPLGCFCDMDAEEGKIIFFR